MPLQFNTDELKPFDILAGRNNKSVDGKAIRYLLKGNTTHNAVFIKRMGRWCIADTTPPKSRIQELSYYEDLMNNEGYQVFVWRIKGITDEQRDLLTKCWLDCCEGVPYSGWSMKRLWIYRLVNSLPYHIKGNWCSRAVGFCCGQVLRPKENPLRKPDGRIKKNETPKTFENRLVMNVLENLTDKVVVST